jgi:hypothetical protein
MLLGVGLGLTCPVAFACDGDPVADGLRLHTPPLRLKDLPYWTCCQSL